MDEVLRRYKFLFKFTLSAIFLHMRVANTQMKAAWGVGGRILLNIDKHGQGLFYTGPEKCVT